MSPSRHPCLARWLDSFAVASRATAASIAIHTLLEVLDTFPLALRALAIASTLRAFQICGHRDLLRCATDGRSSTAGDSTPLQHVNQLCGDAQVTFPAPATVTCASVPPDWHRGLVIVQRNKKAEQYAGCRSRCQGKCAAKTPPGTAAVSPAFQTAIRVPISIKRRAQVIP